MDSKLPTNIDVHVGARVKRRREHLDMSQETLAANLGVTFQQLQKYERGANRISAGRLFELAKALDTTIPYFFEGTRETGRVLRGVAEEADAFVGQADTEIAELVAAFRAIRDPEKRRRILAAAKKAGEPPAKARRKAPRKRS